MEKLLMEHITGLITHINTESINSQPPESPTTPKLHFPYSCSRNNDVRLAFYISQKIYGIV